MTLLANLTKSDVAVTTRYILIDKSDTTGFPHDADERLCIEKIEYQFDKEGSFDWIVRIGFVEEVDATNGSVSFFFTKVIRGITALDNLIDYANTLRKGISVDNVVTKGSDDVSGSTNWQNDVTLDNLTGSNVAPAAGDLVMELEEVTNGAIISFSVTVHYSKSSER
jgi:hypothetical protein